MQLSFEEQETVIRWDRKNPEAVVYTFDSSMKRKLQEIQEQFPDMAKLITEDNGSVEYEIPKSLISIRKPRVYDEETKKRFVDNMKKARVKDNG